MPRDPGQTDRLIRRLRWDELDPAWLRRLAEMARAEDIAGGGLLHPPARSGDPSAALQAYADASNDGATPVSDSWKHKFRKFFS